MPSAFLWILITVSNGAYNGGNVTVVERFASSEDCEIARRLMITGRFESQCLRVKAAPR